MKRTFAIVTAAALSAALVFSACGSGNEQSQAQSLASSEKSAESAEAVTEEAKDETVEETEKEAGSADADKDAGTEKDADSADANDADDAESGSSKYAWLGLEEMPVCDYMDALATYHYITSYDTYAIANNVYKSEETMAQDGINSYKQNGDTRTYSIGGLVTLVDDGDKTYMEQDASSLAETLEENLKTMMESGTNSTGRAYVGTGKDIIPGYSEEEGDEEKYEYYEFNYPQQEEAGYATTERYYMKDGDVFAVYTSVSYGDSELKSVQVIKSMSTDIPDGTFDLPDLSEYELKEL